MPVVVIFMLLVLISSVSLADPINVFTLDDVVKVTVEGADEAICCESYSITITVKALQDVRVREFDVEVYCVSDCCEQKVYDSSLLTDYDMSSSSSKSWTISVKCCCAWCCDDAWIKVKIWILYNFTNTRIDNATLSFYLAPVFPTSYCGLYSSYINLKSDYEALKDDYEDLKDKYEELEDDYEDLLAQYTSLSSAYNQLLTQKTSLELEVEALQNTVEDLKSELNSTKSELARVRSALEDAQRELSEKEYALERLRSEYDALFSDFNACESRYLSLLKEHEALKTEYKEAVSELVVLRVSLALGLLGLALIILAKYVLPVTVRSP